MPWLWTTFVSVIVVLVLLDLFVWHRAKVRPSRRGEFITTGLYVLLAFGLAGLIHAGYERHWLGMGLDADGTTRLAGREAATQFMTLTLWQLALDLDGVFVVSALFSHLRTPEHVRHRVLLWGVLPAMLVRGGLIGGGTWLLEHVGWVRYLITGMLLLAALRMLIIRQENLDEGQNRALWVIRRLVPTTGRFDGGSLLTLEGGRPAFTPLLTAIVLLQTADLWISLDSIPAVLAISHEPFLLFAANAVALLCLRSVYVALEGLKGWLRFVKIGLACALTYGALLTALPAHLKPNTMESLAVIVLCVGAGSIFALRPRKLAEDLSVSALGEDADRAAKLALRRARQAISLVVGGTLFMIGMVMIPGPGPGIVVVFVGLAVLGNEFAWAREMTQRYREKAMHAVETSGTIARRHVRPWVMIPFYLFTVLFFTGLVMYAHLSIKNAIIGGVPVLIGQSVWGYITFVLHRKGGLGAAPRPPDAVAPPAAADGR